MIVAAEQRDVSSGNDPAAKLQLVLVGFDRSLYLVICWHLQVLVQLCLIELRLCAHVGNSCQKDHREVTNVVLATYSAALCCLLGFYT